MKYPGSEVPEIKKPSAGRASEAKAPPPAFFDLSSLDISNIARSKLTRFRVCLSSLIPPYKLEGLTKLT